MNKEQLELAELAKHSDNYFRRDAAMAKLTDQAVITDVALNSEYDYIRNWAADELEDKALAQKVYAEVAGSSGSIGIRLSAFDKLTDRELLVDVAKSGSNIDGRMEALERLGDAIITREVCADIALGSEDSYARRQAVMHLDDQAIIAKVAKNDKSIAVRKAAINRLTDQKHLEYIAINDKEAATAWLAADKLENRELAQDVYNDIGGAALWSCRQVGETIYYTPHDGSGEREWFISDAFENYCEKYDLDSSIIEYADGFSDFTYYDKWIYFLKTEEFSNTDISICRMRPDGFDHESLYQNSGDELHISLDKIEDGWIYFTEDESYDWFTKYKMRTDGSEKVKLETFSYHGI